tara:strand:+ start:971 stop:1150 length:180 start_codon:yes stop_codon:yes gene_type:complete
MSIEELVNKFITDELEETTHNYPRVLGRIQTLLSQSLSGNSDRVLDYIKKKRIKKNESS